MDQTAWCCIVDLKISFPLQSTHAENFELLVLDNYCILVVETMSAPLVIEEGMLSHCDVSVLACC